MYIYIYIYILQTCFENEAKTWLTDTITRVAPTAKPIEALVTCYREHFMGHTQRSKWKQALYTTKLTGYVTLQDLKKHYESFVNIVNILKLCEPNVEESYYVSMFVDSLPPSVRSYMGPASQNCVSLDEVMNHAETAVSIYTKRGQQHGELPHKRENINGLAIHEQINVNANTTMTTSQMNSKTTICYHCGGVGHYTGKCRFIRDDQTIKGKAAWVKRCQQRN